MEGVLETILIIIIIFFIAGALEIFAISKRQKQLEEKITEMQKDIKEVLRKIDHT
ncbi:hypothetical protein ACERII_22870 [Evansella sp. AB-rgal1]|uniref:hypothetical protein n=1 Tax=Evansella sp. AB-rgal1 TaxID=3242696 RepID=UPI00359DB6CD